MTYPVIDDDSTACMDCDRILPEGSPYSTRLVSLSDDGDTLSELVCVYCAHGPATYAATSCDPSELLR